jgi:hypothetical protein
MAGHSGLLYTSSTPELYRPVHIIDACNAIKSALQNPSYNIEHLCGEKVYSIDYLIMLFENVNIINIEKISTDHPVPNKDFL